MPEMRKEISAKVNVHQVNQDHLRRSFVMLFKLCPLEFVLTWSHSLFILEATFKTNQLLKQPVGHDKPQSMVAQLCKADGIVRFKTNHFFPATTATCLFHQDVDRQLMTKEQVLEQSVVLRAIV